MNIEYIGDYHKCLKCAKVFHLDNLNSHGVRMLFEVEGWVNLYIVYICKTCYLGLVPSGEEKDWEKRHKDDISFKPE